MSARLTGRTRTYTASGAITVSPGVLGPVINGFAFSVSLGASFGTMQNLVGGVDPAVFGFSISVIGEDPGLAFVHNISCGAIGGYGSTSGAIHVLLAGGPNSYTFSCVMEEIVTYVQIGARMWAWVIQERPQAGSNVSGSVTFSGITQSFSNTIGAAYTGPVYAHGGHNMDLSVAVDPGAQCLTSSSASIGATFMGQAFTLPWTHTYTIGGTGSSTVDLTSGNSVVVAGYPNYYNGVQVEAIRQVTKQGTINGAINAFDITYPSAIVTEWAPPLIVSPTYTPFSFGDTITLDNYSASVYGYNYKLGGFKNPSYLPWPTPVNQGDGLLCRMNPASLAANGENTPYGWDTALNARLTPFNACTIWQDASVIMDPCTSASGWSANVSLSGGFISVNSASLGGVAVKNYFGYLTEGYRYLEFDIQPAASSGQPLTLTLNNWQYKENMGAAGSLATVRFDLTAPYSNAVSGTSIGFATSVSDSKYRSTGGNALAPGWGIDSIFNLALGFPAGSGTYSIQAIRLKRDADTKLSFIQSDNQNVISSSGTEGFKFALADTDGKRSFNINDMPYPASSTPGTQISAGAGTFSAQVNAINGWHVTPNVSGGDLAAWYFDWSLSNLCGGGSIYTGTPPSTFWINKAITVNPTQLQVQARAAYVLFTPNCGDLTNNAAFGGPFVYYVQEFLRQRTTGVAIDTAQAPISGKTVTESQTISGTASGSGTTDSAGRFITGNDYAETIPNQKDVLSGVAAGSSTITFNAQNRDILRLSYLGKPASLGYAWQMLDNDARLHEVVIQNSDAWYRRSDFPIPTPDWNFYNQVTTFADVTSARMALYPLDQTVYLIVERLTSGVYNLYLTTSQDFGQTWITPTLYMANSRAGTPFITKDGYFGVYYFVYNSGSSGAGTGWITIGINPTSLPAAVQMKDHTGTAIQIADFGWSNVIKSVDQYELTWSPTISGDTTPSLWYSMDHDGSTWTKY